MHNLTSTLLCLSLLVVLGPGCNKDTAGASSGNDSFLAPATAPDLPKREAVDERNFSREGMPEQKRVSDGSEDIVKLTPEDRAAAKRMGPGRLSAPPVTPPSVIAQRNQPPSPLPERRTCPHSTTTVPSSR
jgi:hypothetical protein